MCTNAASHVGGSMTIIFLCPRGGMADAADLILRRRNMDLIDNSEYHVYQNKDGRTRIYDKRTHKVTSYPRFIMSNYLGRTLRPDEQIHHMDKDPTNNDVDNLLVLPRELHDLMHEQDRRKYYDKTVKCVWCGKEFLWTAYQQQKHSGNIHRKNRPDAIGPFCSKSCAGSYGRNEQLRRKAMTECE